jgi:hypothetical protein
LLFMVDLPQNSPKMLLPPILTWASLHLSVNHQIPLHTALMSYAIARLIDMDDKVNLFA